MDSLHWVVSTCRSTSSGRRQPRVKAKLSAVLNRGHLKATTTNMRSERVPRMTQNMVPNSTVSITAIPPIIVVFGAAVRPDRSPSGTLERRVRAAWLYGRSYANTMYLVSGGVGSSGHPEWQVMREMLLSFGVSPSCVVSETAGTDTLQQIRLCAKILNTEIPSAYEVWIATSRYHQARCRVLFAIYGIKCHVVRALPDRFDVPLLKLTRFWARELIALPYDVALAILTRRCSAD
jgi:vancomycin permeability regulator SanA